MQNRAQFPTTGEAVGAIRATLATLAERTGAGESDDLASQLPREIGYYLRAERAPGGERFFLGEFCERVAEREYCDLPDAVYHARYVMEVISEAVSAGEIRDLREQLPESYQALFEAGSRGWIVSAKADVGGGRPLQRGSAHGRNRDAGSTMSGSADALPEGSVFRRAVILEARKALHARAGANANPEPVTSTNGFAGNRSNIAGLSSRIEWSRIVPL